MLLYTTEQVEILAQLVDGAIGQLRWMAAHHHIPSFDWDTLTDLQIKLENELKERSEGVEAAITERKHKETMARALRELKSRKV